jgi:drug/metabolite transporter (DMT)-like permease
MTGLVARLPTHWRGPVWMILSCITFAGMWGLVRIASQDLHPFVTAFFRTFFGLFVLAPMALRHGRSLLQTERIWLHFRRAGSGVIAMFGTFYAIANAPMATAMAINYSAPLIATLGAVVFLGERIRARRMAALAVGIVGVLIVLRPGNLELTPGILAALLAAVATGISILTVKQLSGTDNATAIALYSFVLMLPFSFIGALLFWSWPQQASTWFVLMLLGVCASVGQYSLAKAFSAAEATALLPLDFFRFLLVTLVGIFGFGEPFDIFTMIGAALVLAATVYVAHREAVAARAHKPASTPPLT